MYMYIYMDKASSHHSYMNVCIFIHTYIYITHMDKAILRAEEPLEGTPV